jgi:starch synthase (maltosyl-transferring)
VQGFLHHGNIAAAIAAGRAGAGPMVTGVRVAERRWNLHRFAARASNYLVARHVCVSQAVADFAATRMRLPQAKIVTIPNGVDVEKFADADPLDAPELGVPLGRRIISYVGRLDRQKRLYWLLKRTPEVFRRLPHHDLLLTGAGPDEPRLRRLARRFGTADRVHFAGWRADVSRILAAADLLVLTSAWEGMPNVVLEAMAAGRPVVATRAEGVAEVLGPLADQPARQLVDSDDAAAFVNAVARLAEDASLSQEVGQANRRRVEQAFTLERMVERYCELYRQLLL